MEESMFDPLLFVLALVVGVVVGLIRIGAAVIAAFSGSSVGSVPASFDTSPASSVSGERAQLAELREKQSELRVTQARQLLIAAGINPFQ
jgi:hypothetical protein